MTTQLELVIKAKSEYDAAFKGLQKSLLETEAGSKRLGGETVSTTDKAGKFADSLGKMSTTLARAGGALGLPTEALRALDDVAGVAEMGLKNLGGSASIFSASSIGAAAAVGGLTYGLTTWIMKATGAREAIDNLIDRLTGLTEQEELAKEESRKAAAILDTKRQALVGNTAALDAYVARTVKATEDEEAKTKATKLAGFAITDLATAYRIVEKAAVSSAAGRKKASEEARKADEEAAKGAQRAIREWVEANNTMSGALKELGSVGTIMGDILPPLEEIREDTIATADGAWKAATAIEKQALELARAGMPAETLRQKLEASGLSASQIEQILGSVTAELGRAGREAQSLGSILSTSLKDSIGNLTQIIIGAIQGGGDVFKAVGGSIGGSLGGGIADWLKKNTTGMLGSVLGSLAGPVGTLLGSWLGGLAGKLGNFFSDIFGGKSEVSKVRDAFFGQWKDGFVGVQRALLGTLGEVGKEDWVKQLFDAKSVDELNAVIAKIKAAIEGLSDTKVNPIVVPVSFQPGEISGMAPWNGEEATGMARGGIVLPFVPRAAQGIVTARPGGSPVIVGEGGESELVAPVRALAREIGAAAAAAAGGRGGSGGGDVYLDGQLVGRWVERQAKAGLLRVVVR